jgi:DNA-binding CsgD family transcriptional regulator
MDKLSQLLDIIGSLYDSVIDEEKWPEALQSLSGFVGGTPQVAGLMLIVDPEQAPRPRAALIQTALHLTRAEAALANKLFDGGSLRETAEALGRSINTCKAQLKSIYAKTGCRSHVDLAKALMLTALGHGKDRTDSTDLPSKTFAGARENATESRR